MPVTRLPLGKQVYTEIANLLVQGELAPGIRLRDAELATRLGVSRTPVREALIRLADEGALEADAGRGFRVRPLSRAELRDVGAILAALEPLALRLSPPPEPGLIDRLADLTRQLEQTRGEVSRAVELDEAWHRVLLERCPNRRLLALVAVLRLVPRRYLHAYLREAGRLSLSTVHHARLLDALRQGDVAAAADLLERRWRRGIEEMERWIA